MHQGTVCVKDNQPCGSVFLITLPLHQNSSTAVNGEEIQIPETKEEPHPFTILLVDDNYDFLKFLSESLAKKYHVLKATNGKQALNVLEKEDIDLVVSDIMMPEMDGLELCTTIKNDIRYSHIPIILLTAKASEEHQLEGLSVGADDYITKPFNMEILKLRINKIIEMNVKRQEIFNQEIKIEPSRITITPLDQQLVEKAIQIVEGNISETEFSVEELASSLNISRSYFYKKMIKITGKKPIEFIRTIRMKRAQQLLAESQMQISEIAYTLGYNSPKVFSKHFKEKGDIFSVKLAKCFSCVLLISFVNYAECAVCPRYSLHKSNAMLKHCGGSPKWLEAQSLQGTLLQPFRRIERLPINPQAHFTAYQVRACKTLNC